MWNYLRPQSVMFVLATCLSLAAMTSSSFAQTRPLYDDDYASWQRLAHDNGHSVGLERGESDARARLDFNYTQDPEFQRADIGYRRDLTSIDRYRRVFRQGYAAGYEEGYQRYADVRDVRDVRGVRQPSGVTGGVRRSASSDIAFEYGFADGYKAGVEDVRDNDRFDPVRHDAYRDGNRGYERRYGTREMYQTEYRDGFHAGYTRGYREGRR